MDEQSIAVIVEEVVRKLSGDGLRPASGSTGVAAGSQSGVFNTMDEAVKAARQAFKHWDGVSLETRTKACDAIRRVGLANKEDFARLELAETKIGRYDHKVAKIEVAAKTLGVEDLPTRVWSGDHGLTVEEWAPYGVIGAVTPTTHAVPTMMNNAISILAAGNTVVFNPHPSSKRIFAHALDLFNRAITEATGFQNLMTTVAEPTIASSKEMFNHPDTRVLLVTGGGAVVREALKTPKKSITAGPGNPPVVVDETANIPRAARAIIEGAGFDCNVLCIGEKEIFVVNSVADQLIAEMKKNGCVQLTSEQTAALAKVAFKCEGEHGGAKSCGHAVLNRDLVGRTAKVLAASIGLSVPEDTPMLIGETGFDDPWVQHEQMMCFIPIVRCQDVDQAIDYAYKAEHGYGHTAVIHSMNVATMTRMGKLMNCSIYVKNGPSVAGLGIGGEGHGSYSIASPTGEGITTARTFGRIRRCTMVDYLRIV